jgi:hypothetical protein
LEVAEMDAAYAVKYTMLDGKPEKISRYGLYPIYPLIGGSF